MLCRVGEGRAYWSLGNAHTALGNHQQAMYFAEKHLEIAKEVTVYILTSFLRGKLVTTIRQTPPSTGCSENSRRRRCLWLNAAVVKYMTIRISEWQTTFVMFLLSQTGDKSGEVTARMNLSDLRLVVGLKSNANIHTNIFRGIGTNSCALAPSFQGYSNLTGKSTFFRNVSL